ncbi:glycerophosphoinositol permease, partial [Cryomyces antarcticus]
MAHTATPWALVIRFYGPRLAAVAAIWFIYDFSAYAFGIYSSAIVAALLGPDTQLWKALGWNVLLTLFYLPGALVGSFVSDWLGPRRTLALGAAAQAVVGFAMAAAYPSLARPEAVGGFVAVYGVFLALGELGPGNNIGLVASTTSATAVRGQYYGVAAAAGKIGAFVGGYVFP